MNAKSTWLWIFVAAGLLALIWFLPPPKRPSGPGKILPGLKASAITAVRILPKDRAEIRADRTNDTWQLTKPVCYPANAASIDDLLAMFERLTPAMHIDESALTNRFNADEEFGFADPGVTLIFEQGGSLSRLRIGKRTLPGDQEYLQVVGIEGIYVVDAAEVSKRIPGSVDDWRDAALVGLPDRGFDHIAVTNSQSFFVLQRDATNRLWRMISPFQARADSEKIEKCLKQLRGIRISQFISDEPRTDLEGLGLQPPGLDLALAQGGNTLEVLQFGKSPTNDTHHVYARQVGRNTIFMVPQEPLAPWRTFETYNDFRDPHLVEVPASVKIIETHGEGGDSFTLERQADGVWSLLGAGFPTDPELIKDFVSRLGGLPIAEFTKDVVLEQTLTNYGLATPFRQYILKSAPAEALTNALVVSFGTSKDKVYARRSDEVPIYAVKPADFQRLPGASWQLRDRRIWNFTTNDIAAVTVLQLGRMLRILRKGPFEWSIAPGSQGSINDLAVDEIVREMIAAPVAAWVGRGEQQRPRCGFGENGRQIVLELKNGKKITLEFGGKAPSGCQYAAISLEGQLWIFEFSEDLYRDVQSYLSVPAAP
jgi:hypothetical protein